MTQGASSLARRYRTIVQSRGVVLRHKDKLDPNGVAVVDRAIGLTRRKIAELSDDMPNSLGRASGKRS